MRASFAASTSATVVVPFKRRFRFLVLLLRMCCLNALPRRNLPLFVRLKRLAAPRCVLIFGIEPSTKSITTEDTVEKPASVINVYQRAAAAAFGRLPPVGGRRLRIVCI